MRNIRKTGRGSVALHAYRRVTGADALQELDSKPNYAIDAIDAIDGISILPIGGAFAQPCGGNRCRTKTHYLQEKDRIFFERFVWLHRKRRIAAFQKQNLDVAGGLALFRRPCCHDQCADSSFPSLKHILLCEVVKLASGKGAKGCMFPGASKDC